MSEREVELIVGNAVANQRFEGLEPTDEDIEAVRRIARGETTAADEVAKVIEKYRKENDNA